MLDNIILGTQVVLALIGVYQLFLTLFGWYKNHSLFWSLPIMKSRWSEH
jgi:hypothetical protein